jgi:hypothetical protein
MSQPVDDDAWLDLMDQFDYNTSTFVGRFFINQMRRERGKPPLRYAPIGLQRQA